MFQDALEESSKKYYERLGLFASLVSTVRKSG